MAPSSARATVQLPRSLLVALCAALVLALVAVAFLLGRETSRPSPPGLAEGAAPAWPSPGAEPVLEATPARDAPPVPAAGPQAAGETPPAQAPPGVASEYGAPAERAAVAAYFAQLDQVEAAVKSWSDPQQLALQVVQQATQGDGRGLEELLATARQGRETLRGLAIPPPCREHHAEALALVEAAIDLLGRLGPALTAQDFTALQSLTDAGQALETRTKRLQVLETGLRTRYGLPAAAH